MKKIKKIISGLVCTTMLTSSLTAVTMADGENAITKVYADLYGMDIVYENNVSESDYAGLSLKDASGNTVAYTTVVNEEILHVNFNTPISAATKYTLDVADKKKAVTVNELFYEDFENVAPSTAIQTTDISGTTAGGKKWSVQKIGSFGQFIVKDKALSGKTEDHVMAAVEDGRFRIDSNATTGITEKDITIYMNSVAYGVGKAAGTTRFVSRVGNGYNYVKSYGMDFGGTWINIGTHDNTASTDAYGLQNKVSTTGLTVESGQLTFSDAANLQYTVANAGKLHNYAMRTYDTENYTAIGGYFDKGYLGTAFDKDKLYQDYNQRILVQGAGNSIVFIDDFKVTSCTVEDIKTTNKVELINADSNGIVLYTPDNFGEVTDFSKLSITNTSTGAEVIPTGTSYTGDYLYIDAALEKEVPYSINISDGFGGAGTIFVGSYEKYFKVKVVDKVQVKQGENTMLGTINLGKPAEGTDYVELHNKAFNMPGAYKNATISYKLAYYGPSDWGTDSTNVIKYTDSSQRFKDDTTTKYYYAGGIAMLLKPGIKSLGGSKTNIAKTDKTVVCTEQVDQFATPLGLGLFDTSSKTVTTEVAPHVESYVMAGDSYRIYKDGSYVYGWNQPGLSETGTVLIGSSSNCLVRFYGAEVTQLEILNTTDKIELANADSKGIVLYTPDNLGEVTDFGGLTITNINTGENIVPAGASYTGNYLYIDAALEKDVPYSIEIANGFSGAETAYFGNYKKYFKVAVVESVKGREELKAYLESLSVTVDDSADATLEGTGETKKAIVKDDHAEIYKYGIRTKNKYENASVTFDMAYYVWDGDIVTSLGGATYGTNVIKDGGENNNGEIGLYWSGWGSRGMNKVVISAKDTDGVSVANETVTLPNDKEILTGYYTGGDSSNPTMVSYAKDYDATPVASHKETYVMTGDSYRVYADDNKLLDFVRTSMNKEGYVSIPSAAKGLVWLYGLEVTQMQELTVLDINATNITADTDKIYISFDNSVAGASDFSKIIVKENGEEIEKTCTAIDNTVEIVPVGGIISDAIYEVKVDAGFAPNALYATDSAYTKKIIVTIFANENFDNGLSDSSNVKIDASEIASVDGGMIFRKGAFGIDDANMAGSDYTLTFDYKVYSAALNNSDMNYDTKVPDSAMWFNASEYSASVPQSGYAWKIENDGITKLVSGETQTKEGLETIAFGDAYYDNGNVTLYSAGADLSDFAVMDASDEVVVESTHTAELYQYKVEKSGSGAALYRDGAVISEFTGNEEGNASENGYFGMNASNNEFIWIDNVKAYICKEASGIISSIDAVNGTVDIENFDEDAKDAVIVVAVYDSSNRMVDSYESDIKKIESGSMSVPFTFTNADSAVTYKAFIWDNLTSLKPYCKPAIVKIEAK